MSAAVDECRAQKILFRQTLNRWLVCFMIGVITALIACAIDIMVTYTSQLKYELIVGMCECARAACIHTGQCSIPVAPTAACTPHYWRGLG